MLWFTYTLFSSLVPWLGVPPVLCSAPDASLCYLAGSSWTCLCVVFWSYPAPCWSCHYSSNAPTHLRSSPPPRPKTAWASLVPFPSPTPFIRISKRSPPLRVHTCSLLKRDALCVIHNDIHWPLHLHILSASSHLHWNNLPLLIVLPLIAHIDLCLCATERRHRLLATPPMYWYPI